MKEAILKALEARYEAVIAEAQEQKGEE